MLGSLLCCNGRFSSDYTDYDSQPEGYEEKTSITKGNLGGSEGTAGPNGNRRVRAGQDPHYPPHSPDHTPLSNLFHSIRSGLGGGGGSGDQGEAPVAGAIGEGGEAGGVVVQHVSCRRRHDSNSSSDSDSQGDKDRRARRQHPKINGTAIEVRNEQQKGRSKRGNGSGKSRESEIRGSSWSNLSSSEADLRDRTRGGVGEEPADLNSEARSRNSDGAKRSELPQPTRGGKGKEQKKDTLAAANQSTLEEERPPSGCSFTSSEWGEVTPTESSPGFSAPPAQDRKEDVGSTPGQSSGYMSTSRKSLEVLDGNVIDSHQHSNHHDSPSPSKSKTSPSRLPVRSRQMSRESSQHEDLLPTTSQAANKPALPPEPPRERKKVGGISQGHVRRQSSGRSETLSTCSAKTASPTTKMRLLDLASSRALDRDEEESMRSWSGGSEDTMSLGMSCSGMAVSADTPVFQKMQHKRPAGSTAIHKEREPYTQTLHQQTQPQPDKERKGASASDGSSDTGHVSPARVRTSSSATPQKSTLSIPSMTATSHSGSNDERSVDDDDDDIDELFAKYRSHSPLGVSRSSIGDSRESLASVYSDAGEINYGRIPVSGEITFGLEFDPKLSALRIHLKGCKDLAPVNIKRNSSDPYVKVYLLPDKTRSGKQKSKIKKHTLNPVFNETLTYNISQGELENRTLWLTVWHNDRLGRNDFLGEVIIPMDNYRFDDPTPATYTLQARTPDMVSEEAMQYKGDLVLSLKYVTPNNVTEGKKSKSKSKKSKSATGGMGEIHAMIKSACNLTAARSNGASDPFVKGYLLPDRGKTSKQKTPVVKNSVNPTWNHILIFDGVDPMEIAERCLELTVWDHETLGTNQFLGGARLNLGRGCLKGAQVEWMDARGQECIIWQNMMEQPNSWVDAKLPLRANMGRTNARK